jgi:hypothetical protein
LTMLAVHAHIVPLFSTIVKPNGAESIENLWNRFAVI